MSSDYKIQKKRFFLQVGSKNKLPIGGSLNY